MYVNYCSQVHYRIEIEAVFLYLLPRLHKSPDAFEYLGNLGSNKEIQPEKNVCEVSLYC